MKNEEGKAERKENQRKRMFKLPHAARSELDGSGPTKLTRQRSDRRNADP